MTKTAKQQALETLRELREVFQHSREVQDGLSLWWGALGLDDRRLILAHCGLDDSEKSARRAWSQILTEHRDSIVSECRAFVRAVGPLAAGLV